MKRLAIYFTQHTAEDVQKLTDTQVPMPPWGFSEQVMISMDCCHEAAECLQRYFGAEGVQSVLGGPRWWQIRTLDGVPGEWISQYSDYQTYMGLQGGRNTAFTTPISSYKARNIDRRNPRHEQTEEEVAAQWYAGRFADTQEEHDRLTRVMLYIHGGGYYFGSINTHRFMILRIARKFGGFAFAVNYRKAPQFPFPCALQDCLAAYLYLIRPPPDAKHPPVDPSRIVIAGDSAGGGLTLGVLQLLRDLGLPLPSGAVLLSPWCDLTHSFPSILQNTKTDYIPPYSFIHKPSTLWPLSKDTGLFERKSIFSLGARRHARRAEARVPQGSEMERLVSLQLPNGRSMPITSQIQLYATNAQLFHPLCSPALSGSLGGLPPLYVIAGNNEVLRDEIVYVAHKAANPDKFLLRPELMNRFPATRRAFERFRDQPTQVHLQVFDEQCHVFPMFMHTTAAKYAFRAIASFVKFVTGAPTSGERATHVPDYAEKWQYSSAAAAAYGPPSRAAQIAAHQEVPAAREPGRENTYSGKVPLQRPAYESDMIRERVDTEGRIRAMEPPSQVPALRMPFEEVGAVKLATYDRFQEGHTIWDNRYRRTAAKVKRRRARLERRARRILNKAEAEGLLNDLGDLDISTYGTRWTDLASFGPTDLAHETPPPSSIVRRRDTPDALAILKLSLHLRAKRRRALGLEGRMAPLEMTHSSARSSRSRLSLADDETGLRSGGEHRPHEEPGEPLSKRFGFWKCTYALCLTQRSSSAWARRAASACARASAPLSARASAAGYPTRARPAQSSRAAPRGARGSSCAPCHSSLPAHRCTPRPPRGSAPRPRARAP